MPASNPEKSTSPTPPTIPPKPLSRAPTLCSDPASQPRLAIALQRRPASPRLRNVLSRAPPRASPLHSPPQDCWLPERCSRRLGKRRRPRMRSGGGVLFSGLAGLGLWGIGTLLGVVRASTSCVVCDRRRGAECEQPAGGSDPKSEESRDGVRSQAESVPKERTE
ncbi:hypothetical protein JHW43_003991 [Diplocarpon mali]|nr:hypothetical protein JHW43_003991 [Diplocarpon mali]